MVLQYPIRLPPTALAGADPIQLRRDPADPVQALARSLANTQPVVNDAAAIVTFGARALGLARSTLPLPTENIAAGLADPNEIERGLVRGVAADEAPSVFDTLGPNAPNAALVNALDTNGQAAALRTPGALDRQSGLFTEPRTTLESGFFPSPQDAVDSALLQPLANPALESTFPQAPGNNAPLESGFFRSPNAASESLLNPLASGELESAFPRAVTPNTLESAFPLAPGAQPGVLESAFPPAQSSLAQAARNPLAQNPLAQAAQNNVLESPFPLAQNPLAQAAQNNVFAAPPPLAQAAQNPLAQATENNIFEAPPPLTQAAEQNSIFRSPSPLAQAAQNPLAQATQNDIFEAPPPLTQAAEQNSIFQSPPPLAQAAQNPLAQATQNDIFEAPPPLTQAAEQNSIFQSPSPLAQAAQNPLAQATQNDIFEAPPPLTQAAEQNSIFQSPPPLAQAAPNPLAQAAEQSVFQRAPLDTLQEATRATTQNAQTLFTGAPVVPQAPSLFARAPSGALQPIQAASAPALVQAAQAIGPNTLESTFPRGPAETDSATLRSPLAPNSDSPFARSPAANSETAFPGGPVANNTEPGLIRTPAAEAGEPGLFDAGAADRAGPGDTIGERAAQLNTQQQREVQTLERNDREVRSDQLAQRAAAGGAADGATVRFQVGPDGRRYAVDGQVSFDVTPVPGDPAATIRKMELVNRAANAATEPSAADRSAAAEAAQLIRQARAQLAAERYSEESYRFGR